MIKSVAIVGCGWFGLPLAKSLIEKGVTVSGSKRLQAEVEQLNACGINGFRFDLDDDMHLASDEQSLISALDLDCLVINIPPGLRKNPNAYIARLEKLKRLISGIEYKKLIFVSTTGVYPPINGLLAEQDAQVHSEVSDKLLQAEAMFSDMANLCIVRFAGLVGPKRHPGRFLAGKKQLPGATAAVNLVHLNDCIAAVSRLIFERDATGTYNVCAPTHPTRQVFYVEAAKALGEIAPEFIEQHGENDSVTGKLISSERLLTELNFQFQFSDPIAMLDACE